MNSSLPPLEIDPNTRISDILNRYGDIAEVMEVFGIRRVGSLRIRRFLGRWLTIRNAAFIHRVPLDEFLAMVRHAVSTAGSQERRS